MYICNKYIYMRIYITMYICNIYICIHTLYNPMMITDPSHSMSECDSAFSLKRFCCACSTSAGSPALRAK